ncbi:cation:dicarboxylase symporter family transporter [Spirochaetia bacterium 38H-sp]|uniref:Cation:dicarboxylase symporter family transporter n=1 Tax=Rarispira pelagica TaxID=3141764 RepID=A0ABU9U965_9SPIR
MKIWFKTLLGLLAGFLFTLVVPYSDGIKALIEFFYAFIINAGRFLLVPLVFSGLSLAIYELIKHKKTVKIWKNLFIVFGGFNIGMIVFSLIFGAVYPGERIPLIMEENVNMDVPSFAELVSSVFPPDFISIFITSGTFLLPVFVFAILLGANLSFDTYYTDPFIDVLDGFNRIIYHINHFFVEIIPFVMGFVSARLFFILQKESDISVYSGFLFMLLVFVLFVLIFVSLVMFLIKGKSGLLFLYQDLNSFLFAFFSGDVYFSLGSQMLHGRENSGVPRRIGALSYPFSVLFGRSGSVSVMILSFIVILSSYSSLGIPFTTFLWIGFVSLGIMFLMGASPGYAVVMGLFVICGMYGRATEEGYLIFKPLFPLMISVGTFLDAVISSAVSFLVAERSGERKDVLPEEYV